MMALRLLPFIFLAAIGLLMASSQAQAGKNQQRALIGAVGACKELNSSWTPQWADLVGYWKLNEASGSTTFVDSSNTGSTGSAITGSGITFGSNSYLGKYANFTTAGRIDLGNNAAFNTLGLPLTMVAWIRVSSTSASNRMIFATDTYDVTYCGASMQIEQTSNTMTVGYGSCLGGGSTNRRTGFTTEAISNNKWTHVVTVITGATNMAVYLNGVAATMSYSGTGGAIGYGAMNAGIGGDGSRYFAGQIEEVALWKRALTAAEVKTIYQAQHCGRH